MGRLSEPIGTLSDHYEVVVVGSGYGGGIAASRLARTGRQVCLLERGRELRPGEYPDTLLEAAEQTQTTLGTRRIGGRTNLYDLRVWDDIGMLVGCGLGGTSLINANVSLPADPRVLADPRWPKALRDDPEGLARGYRLAQTMLRPNPTPAEPALLKLASLRRSAEALGANMYRPPVNVAFADGLSPAGVEQSACTLCGDCVTGCNHAAKNTTLMNYLPDAHNHGAEIHTQVDVRWVERAPSGGWHVRYQPLGTGGERFDAPTEFLHANLVVLAAGSVGSTEILLRSRERGLPMSDLTGHRFTGNGDVLAFAYNCDQEVRSVGFGDDDPDDREPVGPCIAGIIDLRDTQNLEDGFVIEEGAIPGALGSLLAAAFAAAAATGGRDDDAGELDEFLRGIDSFVRGPDHGAVANTQVYLVMAHDDGNGRIVLHGDHARVEWEDLVDQPIFAKVDAALQRAAAANGGTFMRNPLRGFDRLITVHPLGGAVMGDDAASGVVDHAGRVFAGTSGDAVHDGLVVCDGAVIPRPLGVNPLLTISALAERAMAQVAAERGWTIDESPTSEPPASTPHLGEPIGVRFTERMHGELALDGRSGSSLFDFILTIVGRDLEALAATPGTRADLFGTARAPGLSPNPLTVHEGAFQLLPGDPDRVESRLMVYEFAMHAEDGRVYGFRGEKHIHDDLGPDLWEDTTRLEYVVRDGADGPAIGRGVLRIDPLDLVRQMRTMQITGAASTKERLAGGLKFGRFFAGALYDTYGAFSDARPFADEPSPRKRRALRAPFPELHPLRTGDGADLRLTRYRAGDRGPVLLGHGLGVASSIFTIDTIKTNLVEHLSAERYDVWLLDSRVSVELPASRVRSTADDVADHDWPDAVGYVLGATGRDGVHVVAHCYGATTFTMAILTGMSGVRSALLSQIAAHVDAPLLTKLKSGLHVPELLDALGAEGLTADADDGRPWWERLYDGALRLWPRDGDEQCDSEVCHRITFLYGQLYEHARLNQSTHNALGELFGYGNISAFEHLARLVREGHLVAADGTDRYMPHLERLAAIPLTIVHGAENSCFRPSSTERTMAALDALGGASRDRHLIPGYGHIDCIFGKDARSDVYPLISAHLERHA